MNDSEHDVRLADTIETLQERPAPGLPAGADGGALTILPADGGDESIVALGAEGEVVGAETTELLKIAAREALEGMAATSDGGREAQPPLSGLPPAQAYASQPVLGELGAVIGDAEQAQEPHTGAAASGTDELGGILRDFELRLNGCVDALVDERGDALEHHYRQELRRAREVVAAELDAREAALRARLDADYRRKEEVLRSNYRKLVETANRMKQQKAQLQQARQQFEEKLDAVNALHRKVEEMRRQLRDHLGPEAV